MLVSSARQMITLTVFGLLVVATHAFVAPSSSGRAFISSSSSSSFLATSSLSSSSPRRLYPLFAEGGGIKAAPLVSGEELEKLLTEWETPLVVDAFAQWCGPCLLMAPEYEAAAQELQGKVRMVKLDTDRDETMAARLNIMGLPTLLFLDQYIPKEGQDDQGGARAVLKGRIEGALRKQTIIDLCEHYFFGAPAPQLS